MKKIQKLIVGGLLLTVCGLSFAACGKDGSEVKVVLTTGFAKDEVFRIDDEICTKAELMVYLTNIQNQYENVYGAPIWNTELEGVTLEDNVKDTVLAKIAQIKTMYLLAEEKGVILDEQEEMILGRAAEEYFQSLNETERELMDVDYEMIERLYREYVMAEKVYQKLICDINPEISDDEARIITVLHILIRTRDVDEAGNISSYSDADKEAAYKKICEIRELAVSGESDFMELAAQYSEDANITYSFGKGEMEQEFEEAAFELGTEEISGVVESQAGYHVIKCINTFNKAETDANKLKIVEQRRKEVFEEEYDAFVMKLSRRLNEKLWDEITLIHDDNVDTADFFDIYEKYFSQTADGIVIDNLT